MKDSAPDQPVSDPTGSWRPAEAVPSRESSEPPTIRSGVGSGVGKEGSSLSQRAFVTSMPMPGDRLESFELERSIGAGGMGAVFLAIDMRLHREVALKVLPPEQSNDSEVVQRFYQEGRAAARLDHENIARVFTIGTDKGYHYIAFEYIEGMTLRQRVQEHGPLPIDEAINYTLQIAGALVHASERGVVHRDIKPSNIIITPQGRAKLVDMGLARRFERGDDDGLTQSGMTLGTFDYISPEQARDPRDVDVRGDLYSLGCTLFHMLTGRPPFPDGTVLQKLLQHQEEPPPDVRAINPRVSDDLATILAKLMAKDRDRRYQSPELLARDLMSLAGWLGLRSMSPEGLVWMSPKLPPPWEKHLVWGLPAATLLVVVAFLFWWGQPGDLPSVPGDPAALTSIASLSPKVLTTEKPDALTRKAEPARTGTSPPVLADVKTASPPRTPAREVLIANSEELAAALANEASGSTLILNDDGPFRLPHASAPPVARRDLIIKAAPQRLPVIRPARASLRASQEARNSLLAFGRGRVTIQDVEFQVDPSESGSRWSAIRIQGTDLRLQRCTVRAPAGVAGGDQLAAIELEEASAAPDPFDGETPAVVRVDACQFVGGLVGLRARGPADLRIRDCTFALTRTTFWLDNPPAGGVVPVDLALRYVSIRPGQEPVFRMTQTRATVVIDHSVIATAKDRDGILATIDQRDRLDWRGHGNLYGGLATYLQETNGLSGGEAIRQFSAWSDDPAAFREVDSRASDAPVWMTTEAGPSLNAGQVGWDFALQPRGRPERLELGARQTPRGRVTPASALGTAYVEPAPPAKVETVLNPLLAGMDADLVPGSAVPPDATAGTSRLQVLPTPIPSTTDPAELASEGLKPMPMAPMGADAVPAPAAAAQPPVGEVVAVAPDREKPVRAVASDPGGIRTVESLKAEIARLSDRGGLIRLGNDLDLTLPSIVIRGPGRIVIESPPGETRAKLRFRSSRSGARIGAGIEGPEVRPALFQIVGGSLELRRIDVILEQKEAPRDGAWDAFGLRSGTDLTLDGCTVTVEGRLNRSAVASLIASDDLIGGGLLDFEAEAQFHASECLLRTEGDLVNVAPGRRLDLDLSNSMIGTIGSLVHGHGQSRGSIPETLKIALRQVSARLQGGLVYLESSPGQPELPLADVTVRDAILTTGDRGAPLIRLDGQDDVDLLQDRLRWDGSGVVYHAIEVYRRHQTALTGTVPQKFDRHSWEVAVGAREKMPFHSDAGFLNPWPASRSPVELDREDLRRSPDAPGPSSGADWQRIPKSPGIRPR